MSRRILSGIIAVLVLGLLVILYGCDGDDDDGTPLTNVNGRSYNTTLTIQSITGGNNCELMRGDQILQDTITFSQQGSTITIRDSDGVVILTGTISGSTLNVSGTFNATIFEGTVDEEDVRLTIQSTNATATDTSLSGTAQVEGVSLETSGSCTGTLGIDGRAL